MIKPEPKSVISLDIGTKRIGLAGCDSLGITVTPLPVVKRTTFKEDIDKINNYCQTRNVKGLVIGLPLDENGNPTKQSELCKNHGKRIAFSLGLPIALVNEHSSSWAAANEFNLQGDRTGKLDSASAVILLEQWLQEGPELKPVQLASNT